MRWINLDIILGCLIGLAASILFASPWNWDHGLKDYQELLVGLLSLAGAGAAVAAVMRQIQHAQEMEEERRRRQNYAARAVMPHALSSLCRYAKDCSTALRAVLAGGLPPNEQEGVALPAELVAPAIPNDVVPVLRQCIEFGLLDVQERLADLICHLQVQTARINAPEDFIQGRIVSAYYFYSLFGDAFEIYARADRLFAYARREDEAALGDPDFNDISRAAFFCGFHEEQWPDLYRQLTRSWSR
jgi:hypothetical protein